VLSNFSHSLTAGGHDCDLPEWMELALTETASSICCRPLSTVKLLPVVHWIFLVTHLVSKIDNRFNLFLK